MEEEERDIEVVKLEDERERDWSGRESGVVKVECSGVIFRLMLISFKIKYGVVEWWSVRKNRSVLMKC